MEGIYAHADFIKIYKAILDSTQEIANFLRYHSAHTLTTRFKEEGIDLKADEIIFSHLKKSGVVHAAASEQKPFVRFYS
jgi:hypothetical protein